MAGRRNTVEGTMTTIKLVVIGTSGVGKTSVREKYINGRFSNSYRATIGADFITKVLPHPSNPEETVTLQIWDTAGQERFSSLSSAFFRGADAAILMFDVNQPETLEALTKWWAEFKERAPLADEDMEDYCCVVVGNKTDLVGKSDEPNAKDPVTKAEAEGFLRRLVPFMSRPPSPIEVHPSEDLPLDDDADDDDDVLAASQVTVRPPPAELDLTTPPDSPSSPSSQSRRPPIPIMQPNGFLRGASPSKHRASKSHSRSSSRHYTGTITSTHTTHTIYHTPSSSLFDTFQSARSSPEPWGSSPEKDTASIARSRRLTNGSASSGSVLTMTPSLFARERDSAVLSNGHAVASASREHIATGRSADTKSDIPDRGPKLFFTSALTGEGISDAFGYVAKRVVGRWEYTERIEARKLHMRDPSSAETIRLGLESARKKKDGSVFSSCCGS